MNLWWISNKTIIQVGNIKKAATFKSFLHLNYKNTQELALFFHEININRWFLGLHRNMNSAFSLIIDIIVRGVSVNIIHACLSFEINWFIDENSLAYCIYVSRKDLFFQLFIKISHNDTDRENSVTQYNSAPVQYKNGCLAASDLFRMFTQSFKFYTFNYLVLKRKRMFEKYNSSNRQ